MVSFKTSVSKVRGHIAKYGVAGALVTLGSASVAKAEPVFSVTTPDIPYEQLGTYTTVILGGLAAMWVIRKLVKTTNRS